MSLPDILSLSNKHSKTSNWNHLLNNKHRISTCASYPINGMLDGITEEGKKRKLQATICGVTTSTISDTFFFFLSENLFWNPVYPQLT